VPKGENLGITERVFVMSSGGAAHHFYWRFLIRLKLIAS
jgi:hypothetical protein